MLAVGLLTVGFFAWRLVGRARLTCELPRPSSDPIEPRANGAGIVRVSDDVRAWCEKHQTYGQTVTVKVKFATFQIITRSRTLAAPITRQTLLRDVSLSLVRSIYPVKTGVRLVGVSVAKLVKAEDAAPELDLGLAGGK